MPLLEIVTEPDIHSADEAYRLSQRAARRGALSGREHRRHGEGRDALRAEHEPAAKGSDAFGTKVEIKNLNSLRAVRDSIAYEIKRQTALLNAGGDG